ncbi:MAG: DUF3305 domain-containing protein [Casimicrobiaceae bacterium]
MRFPVAVIFQRTTLANRWVSERWEPIAVVPPVVASPPAGVTGTPAPVRISDEPSVTRWRFDGHAFELHPTESEGYYLNLVAPDPKAFVMWRMSEDGGDPPVFPVIVTVSYNEAARMLDGGERVDAVPLPAGILAWMEPFVAEHYKPEPKKRVRRNDPLADGLFRRERK